MLCNDLVNLKCHRSRLDPDLADLEMPVHPVGWPLVFNVTRLEPVPLVESLKC
jgi:hypothetical protein